MEIVKVNPWVPRVGNSNLQFLWHHDVKHEHEAFEAKKMVRIVDAFPFSKQKFTESTAFTTGSLMITDVTRLMKVLPTNIRDFLDICVYSIKLERWNIFRAELGNTPPWAPNGKLLVDSEVMYCHEQIQNRGVLHGNMVTTLDLYNKQRSQSWFWLMQSVAQPVFLNRPGSISSIFKFFWRFRRWSARGDRHGFLGNKSLELMNFTPPALLALCNY